MYGLLIYIRYYNNSNPNYFNIPSSISMFIEYVIYSGESSYISKTRIHHDNLPAEKKYNPLTYLAVAHQFGMVPCMVFPDIFRDPSIDVIVYCRQENSAALTWTPADLEPEMGFKLEFYICDTDVHRRCPVLRMIQLVSGGPSANILGWMPESVKQWLDQVVRDLSRMGIRVTGYRAMDIPGKVRMSIAGCSADAACHRLAMLRYVLHRKQTETIKISMQHSLDPRDWSYDRSAGCTVTFSTRYMRIQTSELNENLLAFANNMDTTVCDCPDKFDTIFGRDRCETLVHGGPWWSYTVGLNSHGYSVNVKYRAGRSGYLVDIRPSAMFNPYAYATWIIGQSSEYCKNPILAITYESLALPSPDSNRSSPSFDPNISSDNNNYTEQDIKNETLQSSIGSVDSIKYDESDNESDEIEGLTIISHHESEPTHRQSSMDRIKRRHKRPVTKWLAWW